MLCAERSSSSATDFEPGKLKQQFPTPLCQMRDVIRREWAVVSMAEHVAVPFVRYSRQQHKTWPVIRLLTLHT
jgi:hypothetical protein